MLFVSEPRSCMPQITIEVAYVSAKKDVFLRQVELTLGATAEQAIEQSGVLDRFPEIDLSVNSIGIFSKKTDLKTVLRQGDRIEIYRSLTIDPMQKRRIRASTL